MGFNGPLSASVGGLVPATATPFTVQEDTDETFVRTDPTGTYSQNVTVPAGAVFRAGIYEDAISPDDTDLDMFVYNGATQLGSSADGDSNEEVTLAPTGADRTLTVYIHGFSTGSAPGCHGDAVHVVGRNGLGRQHDALRRRQPGDGRYPDAHRDVLRSRGEHAVPRTGGVHQRQHGTRPDAAGRPHAVTTGKAAPEGPARAGPSGPSEPTRVQVQTTLARLPDPT